MEMVTVFRSADPDAETDANEAWKLLSEAGLNPVILNDSAPGVVEGAFEVRVLASDAARAEQILSANEAKVEEPGDLSPDLDLVAIFRSDTAATAEMEAMFIHGILQAAGLDAVIVGNSTLPNLFFEVRVPKQQAERARAAIADAQDAGPAGAEEAEEASESN